MSIKEMEYTIAEIFKKYTTKVKTERTNLNLDAFVLGTSKFNNPTKRFLTYSFKEEILDVKNELG